MALYHVYARRENHRIISSTPAAVETKPEFIIPHRAANPPYTLDPLQPRARARKRRRMQNRRGKLRGGVINFREKSLAHEGLPSRQITATAPEESIFQS